MPRPGGGPNVRQCRDVRRIPPSARLTPLPGGREALGRRTAPPSPGGGRSRSFRGGEEGGSENPFREARTRRWSGPEKNQRINPPTSERCMYDVTLRDPTDKRSHWCPTRIVAANAKAGRGLNVRQCRDASRIPPDVGPSSFRAGARQHRRVPPRWRTQAEHADESAKGQRARK